jgi:hypothetical protein
MFQRIGKIILMVLGGLCIGVVMAFLFGWIVMLLWNWLMPAIFGVTTITFWQAWGLVVLAHLLFKAGHGHKPDHDDHLHHHSHWKQTFKEKMKRHFGEESPASSSSEGTNP